MEGSFPHKNADKGEPATVIPSVAVTERMKPRSYVDNGLTATMMNAANVKDVTGSFFLPVRYETRLIRYIKDARTTEPDSPVTSI